MHTANTPPAAIPQSLSRTPTGWNECPILDQPADGMLARVSGGVFESFRIELIVTAR